MPFSYSSIFLRNALPKTFMMNFNDELGSPGVTVGHDGVKGLFQPKTVL